MSNDFFALLFCENEPFLCIPSLAAESPVSVMLCVVMRYADDIQHAHNNFRAIADNLRIV